MTKKREGGGRAKSTPIKDLRNKIRGALAELRNRRPAKEVKQLVGQRRRATILINDTLAKARDSLSGKDLSEFERWVDIQQSAGRGIDNIGSDSLVLGIASEAVVAGRLSESLVLTLEALSRVHKPLLRFCEELLEVNKHVEAKDFRSAIKAVEHICDEYGQSYWAIEAKIALLSSSGQAAQAKAMVSKLSIASVGLNRFFVYYFGLRNEITQSTGRLKNVVRRRLAESDLSFEHEAYAEFRVLRFVTTDKRRLASILGYEHLTSKIDLLLTAIRVSFEIIGNSEQFTEDERALARSILNLACVRSAYSTVCSEAGLVLSDSIGKAIDGGLESAMGFAISDAALVAEVYASGLASMVSYSGSETDEDRLRQHALNYWFTRDALILESAPSIPRLPDIYAETWLSETKHPLILEVVRRFWEMVENSELTGHGDEIALSDTLLTSLHQEALDGANNCLRDCIGVRRAWTAFRADLYANALRLTHLALRRNNRLDEALPLRRMFDGVRFDRIRSYGISVDLCNCLHWYSQIDTERQIRTFKRFSIEELVYASGKESLIEACEEIKNLNGGTIDLEFFLSETADIATIELLLEVNGTREALEVRSRLLYLAAEISDESSAQLESAADQIQDQLDVGDVLDDLDETKVSVDEAAILPLIERELASDFARYKSLIDTTESEGSSLDELLKSLRNQSAAAFQIPKSESGDLLINMIQTVLDRFIDDPVYGLDAIVGRRIRHGTISSELRGTLEQVQLIGQRPRTGADYDVPGRIASDLASMNVNRRGVIRAIGRFSAAIDLLVAQLRDEVFQCKTKGKLHPAFELSVSSLMFAAARDAAATATAVTHFIAELFDTFWFMLSIYTERHRVEVKTYIENALNDSFRKLVADLKGSQYTDVILHASIQQASEDLQRRAGAIADWIQIPKARSSGRTYSLNLVFDAAMAYCKARWPNFEPVSIEDIDQTIRLDAHGYPIVFDALRIALENIAQHSGVRQGNRVETSIKFSDDCTKLCFTIISDVAKDAWSKEKTARIESIQEDIDRRAFSDRAKRTSGSGLAKLATIVQQRQSCDVAFGIVNGNKNFKLYFELKYIPLDQDDAARMPLLETT